MPIVDPLSYAGSNLSVGPDPRAAGGRDVTRDMVMSRMDQGGSCGCSSSGKRTKVVIGLALLGTALYVWRTR